MKTIPILFSTPMIKAILNGSKTQTRRIIKPQPFLNKSYSSKTGNKKWYSMGASTNIDLKDWINDYAKAQIGDVFWVRETFTLLKYGKVEPFYGYKADEGHYEKRKWKPSIFMPKEACRIFLKVKNVRVERLNKIDWMDIESEGLKTDFSGIEGIQDLEIKWENLWVKINGKESWGKNPFVWVYNFEIVDKPNSFNL